MFRPTLRAVMFAATAFTVLNLAPATLAADVVKIEEHWELHVGGPEMDRCAPQVSMVMSPVNDMLGDHFVFLLNHSTFPKFLAGGLQVQHWNSDWVMNTSNSDHNGILSNDGEIVRWVQKMTLDNGVLTFDIENGQSQSWGAFGQSANLRVSVDTSLQQLNNYRPAVSIENSGIAFAGNRVSSLVLTKLVWTTADGQQYVMEAPIDIDTDIDP